jgi:hypothetical protein
VIFDVGVSNRWLLLIHQIPPKPSYLRAKIARRLHRIGAVAIKNSVYALPRTEGSREDFQWIARELVTEGGEATVCEASLVEGLRDVEVEALFQTLREADYAEIAEEARAALKGDDPAGDLARLEKRMTEVRAIDFFDAPGRESAQSSLEALKKRTARPSPTPAPEKPDRKDFQKRKWVTRKNVHVDRIASAWLIRRFIDARPTFAFVPGQGYRAKNGEVTFDMFEATFTHIGDRCTFEVLVDQFELREPGLRAIAEIIHDIDIKDGKFARQETAGVASLIAGIALSHEDDEHRLDIGGALFDALLAHQGRGARK